MIPLETKYPILWDNYCSDHFQGPIFNFPLCTSVMQAFDHGPGTFTKNATCHASAAFSFSPWPVFFCTSLLMVTNTMQCGGCRWPHEMVSKGVTKAFILSYGKRLKATNWGHYPTSLEFFFAHPKTDVRTLRNFLISKDYMNPKKLHENYTIRLWWL